MERATLDENQSRPLGGLTTAAVRRLGGDTLFVGENSQLRTVKMPRVPDVVRIDRPADAREARAITCYLTEIENFGSGEDGMKIQVRSRPPALSAALETQIRASRRRTGAGARAPMWFNYVASLLLGGLVGNWVAKNASLTLLADL